MTGVKLKDTTVKMLLFRILFTFRVSSYSAAFFALMTLQLEWTPRVQGKTQGSILDRIHRRVVRTLASVGLGRLPDFQCDCIEAVPFRPVIKVAV